MPRAKHEAFRKIHRKVVQGATAFLETGDPQALFAAVDKAYASRAGFPLQVYTSVYGDQPDKTNFSWAGEYLEFNPKGTRLDLFQAIAEFADIDDGLTRRYAHSLYYSANPQKYTQAVQAGKIKNRKLAQSL